MTRPSEAPPCAAVRERLEAHVDGELVAPQAAALEAHLEICPACAAEHALAVGVRRELRALPELDAPPAVLREITRETERDRFRRPARTVRRPSPFGMRWASAAAALFAAVALGAGLWRGRGIETPVPEPVAADPAAVARATEEARYALAYLTRVHRRAGLKLRDDLFVERVARPSARGLVRSLSPHFGAEAGADGGSDSDRS